MNSICEQNEKKQFPKRKQSRDYIDQERGKELCKDCWTKEVGTKHPTDRWCDDGDNTFSEYPTTFYKLLKLKNVNGSDGGV